jgi:hypothetical protein
MRLYTDLVNRPFILLGALALIGCTSSGGSSKTGGYVSTSARGGFQSIQFEPSGRVFGEHFDFLTTDTGYRGVLREELATMESNDGERITGSRGGSIIDMHVEYEDATLKVSGLFAGLLGRMQMDPFELTTTFGSCSMQLRRQRGLVFSGQRACSDGRIAPAVVQLPSDILRLPPFRRAMLLATLFYL